MRILIATDSYPPHIIGSSIATYNLALGLAERGHFVSLLAPSPSKKSYIERKQNITIYRFFSLPLPYLKNIRTSLFNFSISKIVNKVKPEVVHIQHPFFIGKRTLSIAKKLKIPTITTNALQPESFYMFIPKVKALDFKISKYKKFLWKFIISFCNRFDLVTSYTRTAIDLLRNQGLRTEAEVISNGVDLERFNPQNNGEYLKAKYNIPKDCLIVLYCGRLSGEKQVHILINAIPYVLKNFKKAYFLLVGDGATRKELEKTVREKNIGEYVKFLGFLPYQSKDYPNIYSIADLFVMPSVCELQCITCLEALASGLPVVFANKYALPELVKDKENGFLFEPKNSFDLGEKIIRILSNQSLRIKMGKKSLEIAKNHSLQNTINKYEEVYQRLKKDASYERLRNKSSKNL